MRHPIQIHTMDPLLRLIKINEFLQKSIVTLRNQDGNARENVV